MKIKLNFNFFDNIYVLNYNIKKPLVYDIFKHFFDEESFI